MPDGKSERGEGFGISSGDILGEERTERDWCYMSRESGKGTREQAKIYEIVWRESKASSKAERSVCTWILNISGNTSDDLLIPSGGE